MFLARKHLSFKQSIASVLKPIYGIGPTRYRLLLTKMSRDRHTLLTSMKYKNVKKFARFIDKHYSTYDQVKRIENKSLRLHLKNGSYRGIRMLQGLPSHGQRTHSNHRTARRMKIKYHKLHAQKSNK